jgi:nucleotide-binding universal stress UspA family protein
MVELEPAIRKAAAATRERIERRLAGEDIAWDWMDENGLAHEALLRRSGLSDVIVLGSRDVLGDGPSMLAGDLVLSARMPILIVPPSTVRLDCAGPAMVAWDGSLEASRALRAATPLLAKARSVTLLSVHGKARERAADLPPAEGAEYLSRHGIACELTEIPAGDGTVAEALAKAAAARQAAYLVMGAYGHTRLVETVWGGVTRELFSAPPVPILACH